MAFGEFFLAGRGGLSRAGKIAASCPLGQPITARYLGHLALSWSYPYNKRGYLYFFFFSTTHKLLQGFVVYTLTVSGNFLQNMLEVIAMFSVCKMNIPLLRYWQTRTHCCGHIVAHDVSHVAQTGKHLLRTQNVSDQNQKHFLCPGHKICVRNKCCARGQTGKLLCRQQCVRNNVSSFASTLISQLT